MSIDRITRINALLRREIAELLYRIMHEEEFDLGAVTVTHVETSRDLREARVLVSIRDHESQRARMLALLARHRGEIQSHINRDMGLKYTPRLSFALDNSVERGDHVLGVLSELERETGTAQDETTEGGGEEPVGTQDTEKQS
jgi:ribosome-binding factor A